MARNRQRAKQRQAARRDARLGGRPAPGGAPTDGERTERAADDPDAPAGNGAAAGLDPNLAARAPADTVGRTDAIFGAQPAAAGPIPDADELDDEEARELEEEAEREPIETPPDPAVSDRSADPEGRRGIPRLIAWFVGFIRGCWTELQRVQWPTRSQLFTLTGVVLGFVVIAGGYLGLLDFVFNRLIRALLLSG